LVSLRAQCCARIAQSMPEVKWRLAASWPKALDTLYGGCEFFCKRVAEVTDNRFQIQPFASGEIVPGLQVLDAVSNGTVEMGNTALYYIGARTRRLRSAPHCHSGSTRGSIYRGCCPATARPCSTIC